MQRWHNGGHDVRRLGASATLNHPLPPILVQDGSTVAVKLLLEEVLGLALQRVQDALKSLRWTSGDPSKGSGDGSTAIALAEDNRNLHISTNYGSSFDVVCVLHACMCMDVCIDVQLCVHVCMCMHAQM